MTMAVCFKCGAIKSGALGRCRKCGQEPGTEDERIISIAMTDSYYGSDTLAQIGQAIKKEGRPPEIDPEVRERMLKVLRESKPMDPALEAMKRTIEEQRKEDPLIGAKVAAKEVVERLIRAIQNGNGVHVESLLSALGSLAGYACQASVRAEYVQMKGMSEEQAFTIATGADGKKYYFGDLLNKPLAESECSIWSLASRVARQLGAKEPIDINEVFGHVAATVGGKDFGVPRIPESHRTSDLPVNYVKSFWPALFPVIQQFCPEPEEWPILFGLAIQEVLRLGKDVIDPALALFIVMESAIPASKVDLEIF